MRPTIKTIITDWIQLTCEGNIRIDHQNDFTEFSGEVVLQRLGYGNKNFMQIVDVIYEGRKFGTMQMNPNKDSWNPLMVIFQLANEINYEVGKIGMIKHVLKHLGLQYKNVTRLDIAGDGLGLLNPIQKVEESKIRRVGTALMTTRRKSDGTVHHVRIGTKKSNRSMIGYNKSKELNRSGKYYIKHFWMQSGVEEKHLDKMERIEFTFRSAYLKKIGVSKLNEYGTVIRFKSWFPEGDFEALYQLEDVEFLQRLFITSCKRMYEFVKKGEPNIARAKRLFCLHVHWAKMKMLPRLKAVASKQIKTIKQMTKQMYFAFRHTKARHYLQITTEIAVVNGLQIWMDEKKESWDREYNVNHRKKRHGWISNFYQDIKGEQTQMWKERTLRAYMPNLSPSLV